MEVHHALLGAQDSLPVLAAGFCCRCRSHIRHGAGVVDRSSIQTAGQCAGAVQRHGPAGKGPVTRREFKRFSEGWYTWEVNAFTKL